MTAGPHRILQDPAIGGGESLLAHHREKVNDMKYAKVYN